MAAVSVMDLPDVVIIKILLYLGPEDLIFKISKMGGRWKELANDEIVWKKLSYKCNLASDLHRVCEVSCTTFLGFKTNSYELCPI
jgi:hypothetical protein